MTNGQTNRQTNKQTNGTYQHTDEIPRFRQYVGRFSLFVCLSVCLFVRLSSLLIISNSQSSLSIILIFIGYKVLRWRFTSIIVLSTSVKGQGHSALKRLVSKNAVCAAKLKKHFMHTDNFHQKS